MGFHGKKHVRCARLLDIRHFGLLAWLQNEVKNHKEARKGWIVDEINEVSTEFVKKPSRESLECSIVVV